MPNKFNFSKYLLTCILVVDITYISAFGQPFTNPESDSLQSWRLCKVYVCTYSCCTNDHSNNRLVICSTNPVNIKGWKFVFNVPGKPRIKFKTDFIIDTTRIVEIGNSNFWKKLINSATSRQPTDYHLIIYDDDGNIICQQTLYYYKPPEPTVSN